MLLCTLVRRYLSTQLLFYKGMTFLHGQVGQDKKILTSWVGPSALPIWSEFSYPALPTHVEMLHLRQNWLAHDCYLFLRFLSNRFSIDSMKKVSINNNQEQASIKINFNNLPYFYLAGSFQLALRTTLNQLQTRSKCTQGSNAYQKLKQ